MTIITKQAKFNDLMPDFKRFTPGKRFAAKLSERGNMYDNLTCVQYDGGYLNATDTHRAIRIKSEYVAELPKDVPFLYDVREGEFKEGKFPNASRLFTDSHNEEYYTTYDKLKEARDALKAVNDDLKARKVVNLVTHVEIEGGDITFKAWGNGANDYGEVRTVKNAVDIRCESASFRINAKYLADALLTVNKLRGYSEMNGFYIRYNSHMRPITITDEEMYEILVLPVRVS